MTVPTSGSTPASPRLAGAVTSPGKLNLFLEVTGRRADGYHLLDTLMVPVDLGETVTVGEAGRPGGCTIWCSDPTVPTDGRNTCAKAVAAFRRATGIQRGIGVVLDKRIPHGGGLGGGSGNAAVVLTELNRRYGTHLTMADLNGIAASVGADVPYFLDPVPTRCTGIGEIRERLSDGVPLQFHGVLAIPTARAETAVVFKKHAALEAAAGAEFVSKQDFRMEIWRSILYKERTRTGHAAREAAMALGGLLFNRLRRSAEEVVPEIRSVRTSLLAAGAVAAEVTGSGSGVFAVCDSSESAAAVLERFGHEYRGPTSLLRLVKFPALAPG